MKTSMSICKINILLLILFFVHNNVSCLMYIILLLLSIYIYIWQEKYWRELLVPLWNHSCSTDNVRVKLCKIFIMAAYWSALEVSQRVVIIIIRHKYFIFPCTHDSKINMCLHKKNNNHKLNTNSKNKNMLLPVFQAKVILTINI